MDNPEPGTIALTSCAASWLGQAGKQGLAAWGKGVAAPTWEAPENMPEEAKLWVSGQYAAMADLGKETASLHAWMGLIRASLLDALATPAEDSEEVVKITFKTVDGRRVASLPEDIPSISRSVPVPAVAR